MNYTSDRRIGTIVKRVIRLTGVVLWYNLFKLGIYNYDVVSHVCIICKKCKPIIYCFNFKS